MPDQSRKESFSTRLLVQESLTARRAAGIIAAVTFLITMAGGILEHWLDRGEYPTYGRGLWFALQTVTTVGYGDVTPKESAGRFIASAMMLTAIGFLAVITASVTATLVESGRRRGVATPEVGIEQRLDDLNARLARIEAALRRDARSGRPDGVS